MNNAPPVVEEAGTRTLSLVGNQQLVVRRDERSDVLSIVAQNGRVSLSIEVTKDGPVLRLEGSNLTIETDAALAIDADTVALHGRRGMALSTDGNLTIHAAGDLCTNARRQKINAELGDVDIRANDDVKLDGERIRMNC